MKVILSTKAHLQYKYYVDLIDYEISGVGLVEKQDGGILYVTELFLLNQTVTGTETRLHKDDVIKFMMEKMEDQNFPMEKLRLWWHSHVNVDTFWSSTDSGTINNLDLDLPEDNWWLSIVANKSGKRRARVDTYAPFRLTVDNINVELGDDLELMEEIANEIEAKVKINAPVTPQTPIYGTQGQVLNGSKFGVAQDEEEDDTPPIKHNTNFDNDDKEYSLAGSSVGYGNGVKKKKHKHKHHRH